MASSDSTPLSGGNSGITMNADTVENLQVAETMVKIQPSGQSHSTRGSRILMPVGDPACGGNWLECTVGPELVGDRPCRSTQINSRPSALWVGDHSDVTVANHYIDVSYHLNSETVKKLLEDGCNVESIQGALGQCLATLEWSGETILQQKLTSFRLTVLEDKVPQLLQTVLDHITSNSKRSKIVRLVTQAFKDFRAQLRAIKLSSLVFIFQHTDDARGEEMQGSEEIQGKLIGVLYQFLPEWVRLHARWEVQHCPSTEFNPASMCDEEPLVIWCIPLSTIPLYDGTQAKEVLDVEMLTRLIEPVINKSIGQMADRFHASMTHLTTSIDKLNRTILTEEHAQEETRKTQHIERWQEAWLEDKDSGAGESILHESAPSTRTSSADGKDQSLISVPSLHYQLSGKEVTPRIHEHDFQLLFRPTVPSTQSEYMVQTGPEGRFHSKVSEHLRSMPRDTSVAVVSEQSNFAGQEDFPFRSPVSNVENQTTFLGHSGLKAKKTLLERYVTRAKERSKIDQWLQGSETAKSVIRCSEQDGDLLLSAAVKHKTSMECDEPISERKTTDKGGEGVDSGKKASKTEKAEYLLKWVNVKTNASTSKLPEIQRMMEQVEHALQDEEIPPPRASALDTVMVLDTSDSVATDHLDELKAAAHAFVDGIEDNVETMNLEENLAVVQMGGRAWVRQHLTNDYNRIRDVIDAMEPDSQEMPTGGRTPMFQALLVCLGAIEDKGGVITVARCHNIRPRLIIFTDGRPTDETMETGADTQSKVNDVKYALVQLVTEFAAKKHRTTPVPIFWVPISADADKQFLSALASLSEGKVVEKENISELCRFYKVQQTIGYVYKLLHKNPDTYETEQSIMTVINALGGNLQETEKTFILEQVMKKKKEGIEISSEADDFANTYEDTELVKAGILLPLGTRVVRGPDWKWHNQDAGGPGTVLQHSKERDETLHVMWDDGTHNVYRYGKKRRYDVWKTEDHPRIMGSPELIDTGVEVKRGDDWKGGNEDDHGVGVVIRKREDGRVKVRWQNGHIGKYRYDANGKKEVKPVWAGNRKISTQQGGSTVSQPTPEEELGVVGGFDPTQGEDVNVHYYDWNSRPSEAEEGITSMDPNFLMEVLDLIERIGESSSEDMPEIEANISSKIEENTKLMGQAFAEYHN